MASSKQRQKETLEQRIQRVVREEISIVPYDPNWPHLFQLEKEHLLGCLPKELIRRIEHFGSTAVPGLSAKPIIDILVEVTSIEQTKEIIAPVLESQGYEYFWRPSLFKGPAFYAWFIKRNSAGVRTHHIHMIEYPFEQWDELLFREYLIEHPETAAEYQALKLRLAKTYPNDREAYTKAKTDFIIRITTEAKRFYKKK
ncbi:MAG: GrpB family protein [Sedimentisphaerales bacterium]